jgi:hypothetical protein
VSVGDDANHRESLEAFSDSRAWIEEIAKAVANEVEGEHAKRNGGSREEDEVR